MVRFLCFNTHIHSHKPKKAVESSQEEMHKTLEDHTKVITSHEATSLDTSLIVKPLASSMSATQATESEEIEKEKFNLVKDTSFYQTGLFRKSQSTGSGLCMEGRIPFDNYEEDETECGLSSDSRDKNGLEVLVSSKYGGVTSQSLYQDGACSYSVQISSYHVENGSIFSIGDIQNSEHGVHENSESPICGKYGISVEGADASAGLMHHTEPAIAKSHSLPNLVTSVLSPSEYSPNYLKSLSRSSEDLHVLGMQKKEISTHEIDVDSMRDQQTDTKGHQPEKSCFEIANSEAHYSHSYSALAKDWMIPVTDETHSPKTAREDSCGWNWDEMTSKDFKIKRIEEWVNDCQHYCQLEECESSNSNDEVKHEFTTLNPGTAVKDNLRASPGMDAAKRYISSLSASATTAQIANHGLVVIPFLSAFVSLRILNLSGNNIAKITSGALPRGLHMLSLAKNNISSIEGLRELTRLRVLDLSYNRIFKIGHGLASCSSLKELYLAGNKISEVEGLHRLLKLILLDLRFNKLSTAKCLGQLAANFNSLQAISLEGNPAQKNVGDEQIKKYLQGLLPHLTYFNRQPVKAGTSKDSTDCLRRLGISGHHFDRGRSENKASRKGNHLASQKTAISSPSRRSQVQAVASPKHSRGRHWHDPASGSKGPNSRPQQYDASGKLLILKSEVSMRRARSEGMFSTV